LDHVWQGGNPRLPDLKVSRFSKVSRLSVLRFSSFKGFMISRFED